ncbi:unnamed protein product [Larinioides sclopetarius]|uniref:Lysosome-associated membrane glycoprotein 5 n=1 Tax=Larinioides sclopetarius TaxID=280406 RepID=A0AAV1YSV6_9ARAC
MFLRASQFIFLISFICFIGSSIARPKEDDDNETPTEADTDSPKQKEPEENKEEVKEKVMEEEPAKDVEETVSEGAPIVLDTNEDEKAVEEEAAEDDRSSEKQSEIEEEANTNKTEEEEPKKETSEKEQETTISYAIENTKATLEKEEPPKDTFAVWSDKTKICLLAKLHAVFSIVYSSQRGEEKAEVTIPKTANSKGKCGPNTKFPVLQLSWGKCVFKMVFNKTDEENWALTSMELTYDTAEPLFDGAVNDLCCLLNFSFDNT